VTLGNLELIFNSLSSGVLYKKKLVQSRTMLITLPKGFCNWKRYMVWRSLMVFKGLTFVLNSLKKYSIAQ